MVRGQANQSNVFDTPDNDPFSRRRSRRLGKQTQRSVPSRSVSPQPVQPPALQHSIASDDSFTVDDSPLLSNDMGAATPAVSEATGVAEGAIEDSVGSQESGVRSQEDASAASAIEDGVASAELLPLLSWTNPPALPKGLIPKVAIPQVTIPQVPIPQIALPQSKSWRWTVICLSVLGLFGGIGVSAYFWLAGLPPLPDCSSTTPLSPDAHRLYCAQEAARSGKLEDLRQGLTLVKNWSPGHPLYRDAQASLTKWSKRVLLIARDRMNQNDFKGAIEAINQIPNTSSVYPEAQQILAAWEEEWQKGETLYAKAKEAIKQQDWSSAFGYVTELGGVDHDYWRLQQADLLSSQILVQKESQEALKQAQKLAKQLTPEQLSEAIALLQTVAPNTEAWPRAQQLLVEWSQFLSQTALMYWREGNPTLAKDLAKQIPLNMDLSPEAKDLVQFSHAQKLVEDSLMEAKVSAKQVWALMEATTAAQQIQPHSPIYSEAQAKLQDWQAQLQDLQQLQFANWMADLGQKPTLEYAIAQVQKIPSDRQRYGQAQQLIQDWQNQIQQLEDLPFLQRAQKFAAATTVADLHLAIAQAQVIPSHRRLWTEAQAQITVWQNQIEKIEDQPIFDRAQMLAKLNKLDEAIAVAAEIRPDRSLHTQAQAAIETWKAKIFAALIAEDQAVLTQARNYASQSQLTDAIAAAAQIAPGRPLYLEAQAAIGDWLRERDGGLNTEEAATGTVDSMAPLPIDAGDPAATHSVDAEAPLSDVNGDFGGESSTAAVEQN